MPSGTASASALNDGLQASGIPAALARPELLVLYEGTILADDDVETARYQYDLLRRGTDYWDIHIYMFPIVFSFFVTRVDTTAPVGVHSVVVHTLPVYVANLAARGYWFLRFLCCDVQAVDLLTVFAPEYAVHVRVKVEGPFTSGHHRYLAAGSIIAGGVVLVGGSFLSSSMRM